METLIANLSTGFGAVLAFEPLTLFGMSFNLPMNLAYCFIGAVIGTLIGVLPGLGPVATIAMLLPATYALPPLGGAHHAGRYLLRCAIWRLHHCHPGQPARRDLVGRHLYRRLPDGAARTGRRGPIPLPPSAHSSPAAPARCCWPRSQCRWPKWPSSSARPSMFFADGAGPDRRGGAGLGLAGQGHCHDRAGPVGRHHRHRRQHRRVALRVRHSRSWPMASVSWQWPWACSALPR